MNNEEDHDHCQRQLRLLDHYRKEIVLDLDVHHVIPFLLQHLVLVHDDKERVEREVIKYHRLVILYIQLRLRFFRGCADHLC
jgi:hypothetical protein